MGLARPLHRHALKGWICFETTFDSQYRIYGSIANSWYIVANFSPTPCLHTPQGHLPVSFQHIKVFAISQYVSFLHINSEALVTLDDSSKM